MYRENLRCGEVFRCDYIFLSWRSLPAISVSSRQVMQLRKKSRSIRETTPWDGSHRSTSAKARGEPRDASSGHTAGAAGSRRSRLHRRRLSTAECSRNRAGATSERKASYRGDRGLRSKRI